MLLKSVSITGIHKTSKLFSRTYPRSLWRSPKSAANDHEIFCGNRHEHIDEVVFQIFPEVQVLAE
jgi:hypothetical protein